MIEEMANRLHLGHWSSISAGNFPVLRLLTGISAARILCFVYLVIGSRVCSKFTSFQHSPYFYLTQIVWTVRPKYALFMRSEQRMTYLLVWFPLQLSFVSAFSTDWTIGFACFHSLTYSLNNLQEKRGNKWFAIFGNLKLSEQREPSLNISFWNSFTRRCAVREEGGTAENVHSNLSQRTFFSIKICAKCVFFF